MVIPVGKYYQSLILIEKQPDGTVEQRNVAPSCVCTHDGRSEKVIASGSTIFWLNGHRHV